MKKTYLFVITPFALLLTACDGPAQPTADQVQRRQQEQVAQQSNSAVGMPAIVNFQEKRMLKDIYELRDKAIVTYTYITDMNGGLHKICDSIGYGISGATQYTNPQRVARYNETPEHGNITLPQADPNGLFSPPTDEGTWVLCKDPNGSKVMPVRIEPRTITSPFPLK